MAEEKKSGFRLHALNPMVLLGIIMFLAFLASYIVPAGEYSRVLNPVLNKEVVDPATFHYIQQQPEETDTDFLTRRAGGAFDSTMEFSIRLVNSAEGWRMDEFHNPRFPYTF